MTREEAIERLTVCGNECDDCLTCKAHDEAVEMAISALKQQPPCKIGDIVYGIARTYGRVRVVPGKVTQMFYSDDMALCMVVERVCRGKFGESVFMTKEEAESALRRMEEI